MAFAFVFPGQGSQSVGMMQEYGDNAAIRDTFREASDALGQDLWQLCAEGPASELALTNLRYYIYDLPQGLNPAEFENALLVWMESVNNIINSRGKANAEQANMGTTLVGIIFYQGRYFWMNCGDSRLYRLRDGHLEQLTTDHSLNTISGQKKHSNVITNCIGAGCSHAYLDLMEFTDDVREDDVYLLCSDGLNDMVPDSTIEKLLNEKVNANTLCQEAINEGGFDNVSACILSFQ